MGGTKDLEQKPLSDDVRHRPLFEVAALLGYQPDPIDRSRWRLADSVINLAGMKFYDHLQGCGGGGAIDLVIHARGSNSAEAIRWLAEKPFVREIEETVAATVAQAFVPPKAGDRYWPRVRAGLIEERGLEDFRVDEFKSTGMLECGCAVQCDVPVARCLWSGNGCGACRQPSSGGRRPLPGHGAGFSQGRRRLLVQEHGR